MSEYYTISKAAKYLNTGISTLRQWERMSKIKPLRTAGGHRRYTKEMLDSVLQGNPRPEHNKLLIVGYCRVSTYDQRKDLARQKDVVQTYCEKQGQPFKIITDIGSGLNYKRKGFNNLIHLICSNQCDQLVINYQDRLVRFGFDLLENICKEHNVEIIVLNQTQPDDPNQELTQDVLAVITVFAAKLYGKQSYTNAKIVKENEKLFTQDS